MWRPYGGRRLILGLRICSEPTTGVFSRSAKPPLVGNFRSFFNSLHIVPLLHYHDRTLKTTLPHSKLTALITNTN
ncbi:hypothetical protein BDV24DRAFT_134466 [Aspergillus arachidicola]|uniref:Uncharacterized protein n=1 Tax=Aspergillus arachidicola TaxID=656916 RepID=A0A5N6Y5A5_9EURO|nr:hypothetical protein BDV24DRAFT_134466 [Aspergillus arachidicola]